MAESLDVAKPSLSIAVKLIGFTAITIAAIVGGLSWHFASRHVAALDDQQEERISTYGELLARGLRSAVAFTDRETAREVLAPVEADVDVSAATLFGETGEVLYETGAPSAWVRQTRTGRSEKQVRTTQARVAVIAPVVSLEGPRGTLVIELSRDRIVAAQRTVEHTALAVGLGALAFGVFAAWWIARSLVRRLGAIGKAARAVRANALTEERAVVDSADEIGVLAAAFNAMLAELASTNRELERRTSELQVANTTLREEMGRRSEIELELRQAQKLESVGRLAAGIAHEINTPVQFSADSCTFLGTATTDLLSLVELRQRVMRDLVAGTIDAPTAEVTLAAADDEASVDYLMEQIPRAVERASQGLDRVAKIVRAMKEFAYSDHVEQTDADLNRAIESTLVVASNAYKYVADVVTELGDLPPVRCHLGGLNQVLLNVIVNAAHAIEDVVGGSRRRGTIRIATAYDDDHVTIEIADDGCGIPATILDKIFDPFFTTKKIGKGSGQGLAIARAVVVDKHHGSLTVTSEPSKGSTFTIRIPIAGTFFAVREAA